MFNKGEFFRTPIESFPIKHLFIVLRNPESRFCSGIKFARERNFGKSHKLKDLVPKTNSEWKDLPLHVRIHLAPISPTIEWLLQSVKELEACETVQFISLECLNFYLEQIGLPQRTLNKCEGGTVKIREWELSKHLFESDIQLYNSVNFGENMTFDEAFKIVQCSNLRV